MKEFKTIKELHKRIRSALKARRRELKRSSIIVTEEEIFEELTTKWKSDSNLSLNEIVSDILLFKEDLVKEKNNIEERVGSEDEEKDDEIMAN